MVDKIQLDTWAKDNNQFPAEQRNGWNDSALWKSIKLGHDWAGIEISIKDAQEAGKTHCNSCSMYNLAKSQGWIEFAYAVWCQKLMEGRFVADKNGTKLPYMKTNGWMNATLVQISELFGFAGKFTPEEYNNDYDKAMSGDALDDRKGYKITVIPTSSTTGTHFMAGYVQANKEGTKTLYLSDTSYRGIRVVARNVIPRGKFIRIQEY